ncbi:MAG: CehA/McbA family metallohydrolase [Planctomyces sp.]|nr:CehA/McbA family metallohydrolase [Planctomyces sp.]
MPRRLRFLPAVAAALPLLIAAADFLPAAELEIVRTVEPQPLEAATERLIQALEYVGSPLPEEQAAALRETFQNADGREAVSEAQRILDQHVLAMVTINPESRVSAVEGPVRKELLQQGWRTFLIKVHNQAGITPRLEIGSPNSAPPYQQGKGARERPQTEQSLTTAADVPHRFLDIQQFDKQPLKPELSGLEIEYRLVQLYSRDVGRREATLTFSVGQGTQDLGFRNEVPVLFESVPSVEVVLDVLDHDGEPTTAAFIIRDRFGRVYPNPARRIAPDFFFHQQIYRGHGETVALPSGTYSVAVSRGPEYLVERLQFEVPDGVKSHRQAVQLTRWIHPKQRGWFSGDHHVHAAGCAHYDSPTEGVGPGDMLRHILGEDLNVGCVLSWGPCWYTQKQYFEGRTSDLSRPNHLMRYDVEVSGFPSSHAGHLCLLRLTEDDYPGTTYIEEWPSWTLPVLQWGQEQAGVVGYSHSGWGLALPDYMPDGSRQFPRQPWGGAPQGWQGRNADKLPDPAMPPFDGIGANEYIVTGPLGRCDFISAVDTPAIWELNIWYHTLNCGVTTRISGETDFPCIYGDKVGLGRIYVKLPTDEPLDYDAWVQGLKDGRSYCGDGMSHVFDFRASSGARTVELGQRDGDVVSRLDVAAPGPVRIEFDVAALLEPEETDGTRNIRNARLDVKPYWHIERCRIGETRNVPVEVIVNGEVAATQEIAADGSLHSLSFDVDIPKSAWVAVRILPSVHTNPIWVQVDGQPVRASRASAEWCRQAVDVCWKSKAGQIREPEQAAARAAYDEAARYYEAALAEAQ